MSPDQVAEDSTLGLRHTHTWQEFSALPRLQSAHDHLRWDVSKSRILAFTACVICDDVERSSVEECEQPDCAEHRICARPHR